VLTSDNKSVAQRPDERLRDELMPSRGAQSRR
jgi:hypothetical protein